MQKHLISMPIGNMNNELITLNLTMHMLTQALVLGATAPTTTTRSEARLLASVLAPLITPQRRKSCQVDAKRLINSIHIGGKTKWKH